MDSKGKGPGATIGFLQKMNLGKFHRFTVHFDSLSFFTPTYALSHTTIY
jgi:hypothetical protein